MKKLMVIVFFTLSSSLFTLCWAQYVRPGDENLGTPTGAPVNMPPKTFEDNLSIGGSFSLQFGSITFVELEPLISYHVGNSFMVGIGPVYQYVNENFGYGAYSSSSYGARVAALFFLPDELSRVFIMGEYDVINVPEQNQYNYQIDRGYLTLPLVGVGYKEKVSDKVFFCIYGLWNFNNSPYNPFSNPIINAGFDIGLWH
jgi:hypothetical protein